MLAPRWLAAIWLPVLVLVPAGLANVVIPGSIGPDSPALAFVLFAGITAAYAGVGAFVIGRAPRNAVGWILWLIGLLVGLNSAASAYTAWSLAAFGGTLPGGALAGWLSQWAFSPPLAMALLLLPLLFPDGRPPSPRWQWLVGFSIVIVVTSALPDLLAPGPLQSLGIANPTGWTGDPAVLDLLGAFSSISPVVALPIVIASAVVRYRRGTSIERAQLRWLGATATLSVATLSVAMLTSDPVAIVAWIVAMVGVGLLPVAIGMAIVRYRLYEIDRIISRTVGWAASTAMVVGLFGVGLIGLETLLAGVTDSSTLAVAGSTLVACAAFQPIRRHVQSFVDRRFDRARYDAGRTAGTFAARLRGQVELGAVEAELLATIASALRPAEAGLWIRPSR